MVALSIKTNFPEVQLKIDILGKQARYATAVALTRTAQDAQAALRKEMQAVFDRPTRYTLNSVYVDRATKNNLSARVWLKDDFGTRAHYLMPQIEGGSRPQKRFEELLKQRGILSSTERTVPGVGAKIDANGNMSRGQIVQILSQLGAFNLAGSDANATHSKRSKAKRANVSYFVARKGESRQGTGAWKHGTKTQHLRSGVYVKYRTGEFAGYIQPVLLFVKSVHYRIRFRFMDVALTTAYRVFPAHFERELAEALRTARWT